MTDSPFIIGAVVAVYSSGRFGLARPSKQTVSKVHKNGNFTIGGTLDQWRPSQSGWIDRKWEARRAGGSYYSGMTCEIWSAEHDQMLVDARNADRWANACAVIDKVSRRPPDDASLIDALEAVAKRVKHADATP